MGFGLKPREEKFYGYLLENTQLIRDAADVLQEAINRDGDLSELMVRIDELEKKLTSIRPKLSVYYTKPLLRRLTVKTSTVLLTSLMMSLTVFRVPLNVWSYIMPVPHPMEPGNLLCL